MTTVASIASTIRAARLLKHQLQPHIIPGITGTDSLHPHNPHINSTGIIPISQMRRLRAQRAKESAQGQPASK